MNENKQLRGGAVVVAQFVERLLPTWEVHGSNPVIGKLLYRISLFTVNCNEKTKEMKKRPIKKQEAGMVLKFRLTLTLNLLQPQSSKNSIKNFRKGEKDRGQVE